MQSLKLKFLGVTILQGVEFPIFLLIFEWALQQCSATALPVILGIFGPGYRKFEKKRVEARMTMQITSLKAHSHQARLRQYRTHVKRPARSHQARLRPSTDVNALKIERCSILSASTSVDGRRRASTSVYVRRRRIDHPMASDVVTRDMFMNIQLWRTKH